MMTGSNGRNRRRVSGRKMCLLAMGMALFLTACGGNMSTGILSAPQEDTGSTEESVSVKNSSGQKEWIYVPEVVLMEDERGNYVDYGRMQPIGDSFFYVLTGGDTENSEKSICRYSLTERTLESVPINWSEGGAIWDAGARYFCRDGSLYMTANVYPADYSSMKRFLCRFDEEGNCLFSRDITEQAGRDVSLHGLTVDGQGRLYIFVDNGELLLYTGEGEYHGSVKYGSPESQVSVEVKGACEGADGRYYVCISKGSVNIGGEAGEDSDDGGFRCTLAEIDFEGAALREAAEDLPDIMGICTGQRRNGDTDSTGRDTAMQDDNSGSGYDLLLYDERAVYGYSFAAWKSGSGALGEELFSWQDSDINGYCVKNLYQLEDGRLCAMAADWINEDAAVVLLEKRRAEQAPRREELVLVTVGGESNLATMAVKFNRGNSRYHLTVKSYDSLTDLYNAVLAKEPMDLIDLSGVNIRRLKNAGLLEDLAPYADRSNAFERSDFVDGILEAYTFDDSLVSIPASFYLWTVAGNRTQLENPAGLTLKELLAAPERYPGKRTFDGMTREEMMQYLMMFNVDTFIDRENGACYFDSEEFRAVLEYVKQLPDSVAIEKEGDFLPTKVRNGEVLFAVMELDEFSTVQEIEGMYGEDGACVGFPTPDGQGGHLLFTNDAYGIAAVSEHKEGAWQFIEDFLTQEKSEMYYIRSNNIFYTSFPTLKKALDEKVEASMEAGRQTPADKFPTRIYSDGTGFQFHALTRDEVNVVLELIPKATPFFSAEEDEIIRMINEEAPAYYSGQKKVEDVVSIIQNRVQLYVNENMDYASGRKTSDSDRKKSDGTALEKDVFREVLLGNAGFLHVADGKTELVSITDIPALFDGEDPFMKIWEFSVVDLNGDGEEEGAAVITGFSGTGYTRERIYCETGTHEGWDTFVADGRSVTEEDYLAAAARQTRKTDAEWYDFNEFE